MTAAACAFSWRRFERPGLVPLPPGLRGGRSLGRRAASLGATERKRSGRVAGVTKDCVFDRSGAEPMVSCADPARVCRRDGAGLAGTAAFARCRSIFSRSYVSLPRAISQHGAHARCGADGEIKSDVSRTGQHEWQNT